MDDIRSPPLLSHFGVESKNSLLSPEPQTFSPVFVLSVLLLCVYRCPWATLSADFAWCVRLSHGSLLPVPPSAPEPGAERPSSPGTLLKLCEKHAGCTCESIPGLLPLSCWSRLRLPPPTPRCPAPCHHLVNLHVSSSRPPTSFSFSRL